MKILDNFRNYISNANFKLIFTEKLINIIGFDNIINISRDNITIKINEKKLKINGSNIEVIKLLDSEILIEGNFKEIKYDE